MSKKSFFEKAFERNFGLISPEEGEVLKNATIAIPGMGGVGGVHLITLTRMGIGNFHLADMDVFEVVNFNRQYGAKTSTVGLEKLKVMEKEAKDINPHVNIVSFEKGLNPSNLEQFLDNVDVVIDGLDFFEFDLRRLLFNRAREKGIYVITAGPLGFGSAYLIFSPHRGMSFDEFFDVYENMPELEKYLNFAIALAPRGLHVRYIDKRYVNLRTKKGPSSVIACNICASCAAIEAIRIILKRKPAPKVVPYYFQFDPYVRKYKKGYLIGGNRNPLQRLKKFWVMKVILKLKALEEIKPPPLPSREAEEEIKYYLIKAGRAAPSGDNSQPWKFSILKDSIQVYLDPERDRSFFNVNQIASLISCGAVVENICSAAKALGLYPSVERKQAREWKEPVATICLNKEKTERDVDSLKLATIWNRCTNRRPYFSGDCERDVLAKVEKEIEQQYRDMRIYWICKEELKRKISEIVYKVDRIRCEFKDLHLHLMKMIRFSQRESYRTRDGLPLKNLEAGLHGELFLRISRPWWVMQTMNMVGASRAVAHHSRKAILNSSGVGLLISSVPPPLAFLEGGMALERIWLRLTLANISFQPMTAITLFWERWKQKGKDSFLKTHQELLEGVWPEYEELFPGCLSPEYSHIMLFRFGRARGKMRARTYRRPLKDLLILPGEGVSGEPAN